MTLRSCRKCHPTIASELLTGYELHFEELLADIAADVKDQVYEAVLFAHIRSYDETPEKVRITEVTVNDESLQVESEAKVGKLMAGFRDFVVLLAVKPSSSNADEPCSSSSASEHFVQIRGTYPTMLVPVATQEASVVLETIQRFRRFKEGVDEMIVSTFGRVVHLTLADSYSSNIKAERADAHLLNLCGATAASFRCRIHRMDTCEKRVVELLRDADSGMMATTLMLGQAGLL